MVSNRIQTHCIIWMTITVQGFPFLYFQGSWRYISVLLQISHCACRSTPLAFLNFKKASCKYELLNFLHLTVQAISVFVTGVIKLCLINFHFSKKSELLLKPKEHTFKMKTKEKMNSSIVCVTKFVHRGSEKPWTSATTTTPNIFIVPCDTHRQYSGKKVIF